MIKRLSLLGGLAIVAVVCNHSIQQSFNIFHWLQDASPKPDYQLGLITYYGLLTIEKLMVFSVPAFLFVSGFFVAYAARSPQATFGWRVARRRVIDLLIPYLVWSVVIFISDAVQGNVFSPLYYVWQILHGAIPIYFFVNILCQFYLLAPLVTPLVKKHGAWALAASVLLQMGVSSLIYLNPASGRHWQWYIFPTWAFFFTSGILAGLQMERLKQWLSRHKSALLAAVIIFGLLAVIEADVMYRLTALADWRDRPYTLPSTLYAIAFVLCFLAFDHIPVPGSALFNHLSPRTYGIYLIHPLVLDATVKIIVQFAPAIGTNILVLQPILIAAGVGAPLALMAGVARSPMRSWIRYLFG